MCGPGGHSGWHSGAGHQTQAPQMYSKGVGTQLGAVENGHVRAMEGLPWVGHHIKDTDVYIHAVFLHTPLGVGVPDGGEGLVGYHRVPGYWVMLSKVPGRRGCRQEASELP